MSEMHKAAFARTSNFTDDCTEQAGITRLEYFAAAALTGLLAVGAPFPEMPPDFGQRKVEIAFDYAEAMCAESEKRKAAK